MESAALGYEEEASLDPGAESRGHDDRVQRRTGTMFTPSSASPLGVRRHGDEQRISELLAASIRRCGLSTAHVKAPFVRVLSSSSRRTPETGGDGENRSGRRLGCPSRTTDPGRAVRCLQRRPGYIPSSIPRDALVSRSSYCSNGIPASSTAIAWTSGGLDVSLAGPGDLRNT
jgi:hypothetical protein